MQKRRLQYRLFSYEEMDAYVIINISCIHYETQVYVSVKAASDSCNLALTCLQEPAYSFEAR